MVLFFITSTNQLFAQKDSSGKVFSLISVRTQDNIIHNGMRFKLLNDSVTIFKNETITKIPVTGIKKITCIKNHDFGVDKNYGRIIGSYLGLLFLSTWSNRVLDSWFVCGEFLKLFPIKIGLLELVTGGFGSLIGKFVNPKMKDIEEFDIEGNQSNFEFERFYNFSSGGLLPQKLHLNIHTGYLFDKVNSGIKKNIEKTGFSYVENPPDYHYHMGGNNDPKHTKTDYTMLRDIQISYSFFENLDFGFSYTFLNEPELTMTQDQGSGISANHFIFSSSNTSAGYYLFGRYKINLNEFLKRFSFSLGFGAGVINTRLEHLANCYYSAGSYYYYNNPRYKKSISNLNPGLFFNPEIKYYIYDGLIIGLCADYHILPGTETEPIPEVNIPS